MMVNKGVACPEFTTTRSTAEAWADEGYTVFCRTLTRANSGRGIRIAENADQVVDAPLYTKYIKKKKEFRVHVFQNEVLDVQEKRLSSDAVSTGFLIRNRANGFVFCREDVVEPTSLRATAVNAVAALGLDFGAVDVIWNEKQDKCYALEVNTAPGLEGTTLDKYTDRIIQAAYS